MNSQEGLDQIKAFINSHDAPILVLVSGGSCSGKTTFANTLYQELGASVVTLLHLDDYFRNINDPVIPKDSRGCPLFDVPDAYCEEEIVQAITDLLNGQTVWVPRYYVPTNMRISGKGVQAKPNKVLVVDGLFAIHFLARRFPFSINVYVRAEPEIRLQRRINRDTTKYHIPRQYVISYFLNTVMRYHTLFVSPQKELAGIIVDTGQDFPDEYFD